MASSTIAIVGGGLSSARLVSNYREAGGEDAIVLISADSSVPYHRPPLSKRFLRGEAEAQDTYVQPPDYYAEHDVDLRLETVVERLDAGARELVLRDGERVRFDRLVIASGAMPRRLQTPGGDLPSVYTLRRLADSAAIREAARGARRAVIVGAGFIGMEVAASLRQLGLDVALVHRGTQLFEGLRAPQLSESLTQLYLDKGVNLHLDEEVVEFGAGTVRLRSGEELPADLAVVGIGVTPSVEFLEGSGLEIQDGVVVSERYETSLPGVYACGDVARFWDPIFERSRRIEHWSNANLQGAGLGKLLATGEGGYDVVSSFFSEMFGLSLRVFGDLDEHDELEFRGTPGAGPFAGLYLSEGKLVAAVVGEQSDETNAQLTELIRRRAPRDEALAAIA
jgi:3-phenylpropionate/trans-cinnamate dioxygenase ferredoxin reductase component